MRQRRSIGPALQQFWSFSQKLPFGQWLFSRILGWFVPYTGTVGGIVRTLSPGYGKIELKDRRKVRNHLKSVHAIALANLAEMVTGLTLLYSLPDGMRAILVGIQIRYVKKARGLLTAECHCEIPQSGVEEERKVVGEIRDMEGEVVAEATAIWKIGAEQ